jgi:hypothetical protein
MNPQRNTLWKGDICIESPDPTLIYHDPAAYRVQDCRYIISATPKTTNYVKETFGVEVDPENTFDTDAIYDRPSLQQSKDRVMLYEYWYKEKGTINVIYAANGKVLKRIPNVYKHGRYPFVAFIPKKKRKSLTGIGEPQNIIDNQELLNKFVEMQSRSTMLTANPILLVDDTSGVDATKFVAKPGIVQRVRNLMSGVPMKWFEPPTISADVPKTIEMLQNYIERMGGVYDANTGETPGGVTAAAAIQMLQEQGSIPIKGIAANLNSAIKEVYELMIELIKEFYTEERYIRIVDDNGGYTFQSFVGAAYAEVDLDVQVSAGSSTPTSKAYIHQLGSDLFTQGVIPASMYVDMLDGLPNKDKIVQFLREREDMANQQQQMAAQGPDPQMMAQQQQAQMEQQAAMDQQKQAQQFHQQAQLKQMDNETKLQIAALNAQSKAKAQ